MTDALKVKGMWEETIIVFSGDNGGWVSKNGTAGGNNYPLAGGKYNNWEGGIRMNSFVSGGFLPEVVRGSKYEGLVAAWDWYGTFCALAGVVATDHRAALAKLPPIDSISMVPVLMGTKGVRPRKQLPLATEPRPSNLSTAHPCSALHQVSTHNPHHARDYNEGLWQLIHCSALHQPPMYDGSVEDQGLPEGALLQGNCSGVIGANCKINANSSLNFRLTMRR